MITINNKENQMNQTETIQTTTTRTLDVTGLPTLAELNKQYLLMVLDSVGGKKAQAAKILGISVLTVYKKLQQYNQVTGGQTGTGVVGNS